jgi:hypothetical protein
MQFLPRLPEFVHRLDRQHLVPHVGEPSRVASGARTDVSDLRRA